MKEAEMKAIILSSGGVDSTTCVSIAMNKHYDEIETVSVDYGQRHIKELKAAAEVAEYYGLYHTVIDLTGTRIYDRATTPLIAHNADTIPEESYSDQINENGTGKVSTYIPFRNGLMLAALAGYAQSAFPDDDCDIYIGAHADDAAGNAYADCRPDFLSHMQQAIKIGTYEHVNVIYPLATMNKASVVKLGIELETPYQLTWSCYKGGEKPCGKCGTCIDRANAFKLNHIADPAL